MHVEHYDRKGIDGGFDALSGGRDRGGNAQVLRPDRSAIRRMARMQVSWG